MLDAQISPEMEEEFKTAVMFVWAEKKASTSFIQRKLGIGYNRAARIIERMEALAIVSAADHVGNRTVRTPSDLRKALNIREEIEDIAGSEMAPIMMKALLEGLRTLPGIEHAEEPSTRPGRPPMKETPEDKEVADKAYRVTASELQQFIERIERLEAEKREIMDQCKEVYAEAKARGYDTKVMRKVIALRKREPDDIAEEEAVLDMYKEALGMG